MLRRIRVGKNQRGFLYRRGDYVRYLRPGVHWVFGLGVRAAIAFVSSVALAADDLDVIAKDHDAWSDLKVVDLQEHERALVWTDGRLHAVLGPGRAAFWKVLREVNVEVVDARGLRFEHPSLARILALPSGADALASVVVPQGSVGLLLVDEKVREELGPGLYALWKGIAHARVEVVDLREQTLEVNGQEVLTRDHATVRLNLLLTFRVTAPRRWLEAATDARAALYHEVQLAARTGVAARTLDELLAAKDAVAVEIQAVGARRAEGLGAAVLSAGVKDVILPGEMRALSQQVLEAERRAQANLITRREETAATRALLNTAKLYAEHPALLRLRELEAAERIAERVKELRIAGVPELLARLAPGVEATPGAGGGKLGGA